MRVNNEKTYIQLLQITGFSNNKVIQCKAEIHRAITYCGMHCHISVVANGHSKYIQEIFRDQSKQVHTTRNFLVTPSIQISNSKINETSYHTVTFAGSITTNGDCTGTQFSDPYGTWNSVVVQAIFKIILQEHYARK